MSIKIYSKKIVAVAVLVAIVISCAPTPAPKVAEAASALDFGDTLGVGVKSLTDAASKYAHTGVSIWGFPIPFTSLDSIMKLAVKQMIAQLQQQVIGWVTGGGNNGGPIFEADLSLFVNNLSGDTAKRAIGNFSNSGPACSYFKNDVVSGLNKYFDVSSARQVGDSLCDAEREVGKGKVQAFLSGDFQAGGGWQTWNAMTHDNSNPYGSFLVQRDTTLSNIAREEYNQREILDQGHGYHGVANAAGKIVTPGAVVADQVNQVVSSNIRQLELSKTFDDIVNTLATSLISKVMSSADGLFAGNSTSGSYTSSGSSSGGSTSGGSTSGGSTSAGGTGEQYVRPTYPTSTGTDSSSNIGGTTGASKPQNVSVAGTASQISTYVDGDGFSHDASLALTGSRNRNPKYGGVSITKSSSNPWWQVDLGNAAPIDHIDITPRIDDGYGDNLTGFYVIISKDPIVGGAIPVASANVWVSSLINPANPREDITTVTPPADTIGRYVRIQETRTARLEIAGVEVYAKNIPFLTLLGDNPMTITQGSTFKDPGAVAIDQAEGDISNDIITIGTVDTNAPGTYDITYTVRNSAGVSSGDVVRHVIVQ